MKSALIIYHSKTGTTKKYAEKISEFLETKNVKTENKPPFERNLLSQ